MKNSKHNDGYRAPETVESMELSDPTDRCWICTRDVSVHDDMDHDFMSLEQARAKYDQAKTKELQAEREAQIRKDGSEARSDLRDSVRVLIDAHFRAGNQMNAPDTREMAEETFSLELDDIQMWLETLEETLGA